jgi:hypothetical protein
MMYQTLNRHFNSMNDDDDTEIIKKPQPHRCSDGMCGAEDCERCRPGCTRVELPESDTADISFQYLRDIYPGHRPRSLPWHLIKEEADRIEALKKKEPMSEPTDEDSLTIRHKHRFKVVPVEGGENLEEAIEKIINRTVDKAIDKAGPTTNPYKAPMSAKEYDKKTRTMDRVRFIFSIVCLLIAIFIVLGVLVLAIKHMIDNSVSKWWVVLSIVAIISFGLSIISMAGSSDDSEP